MQRDDTVARIIKLWPVITGVLLLTVWLIRLESKILYIEESMHMERKEIKIHLEKLSGKLDRLIEQFYEERVKNARR